MADPQESTKSRSAPPPFRLPRTLAEATAHAKIDVSAGARDEIARKVLGVMPNCLQWFKIHPPVDETYSLLMPALLKMPKPLRRSDRLRGLISLAMLAATRAAGCPYCTAHTCTLAKRTGVDDQKVNLADKLDRPEARKLFTSAEHATLRVAAALGSLPSKLEPEQRRNLEYIFSTNPEAVERIILAVSLMGWLNKFMDAFGIPLEHKMLTITGRVIAGDYDPGKHLPDDYDPEQEDPEPGTVATLFQVLPLLPSLLFWTGRRLRDVPGRPAALRRHLLERTGADFDLITRIGDRTARRAIAKAIILDLDPRRTQIGLYAKAVARLNFARRAENPWLIGVSRQLLARAQAAEMAERSISYTALNQVVTLTDAIGTSPARISPQHVSAAEEWLSPGQLVELVGSASLTGMLQRYSAYKTTPLS